MCALESHWHVQNANSVTTILLRIRKLILTEWKQVNIVDSAKNTQHIKRLNSLDAKEVTNMGENTVKETAPKAPKKSWFKGLKAEFKKIIWPDKKSLARESAAVVASAVALGIIIKVLDVIINYGIEFLMSL